ncbi:class I SAM-dependent methyltransferase [Knoellia koreensis]|uniref:Class I SAM-dependent methyltransferase n=1 Tax=Knoellia koreensis TaxID=2730921 RepID=A0A849HJJ6_9MICO|nr:class I SAM-dependent methyltransferase [Knoellia sp. DB2414S]NNM48125.1 class I SAM-dependent methyltransferase [Knoellia sp. DB2414S]
MGADRNVVARQDEGTVRAAYDVVAPTYADHFRSTEAEAPLDLAMVEHFASLLPDGATVLDAGCGAGRMLPLLAGLGCHVEGVDLSPAMVSRARVDHPDFVTRQGSLTDLPHADETFDGVFSWYSTIHSPDAELPRLAAELRRVARPNGVVLVAFQSGSGVRDVAPAYAAHGLDVVLERYNRTPDQVVDVLAGAGMTEVARMEQKPLSDKERDAQAVVIARVS